MSPLFGSYSDSRPRPRRSAASQGAASALHFARALSPLAPPPRSLLVGAALVEVLLEEPLLLVQQLARHEGARLFELELLGARERRHVPPHEERDDVEDERGGEGAAADADGGRVGGGGAVGGGGDEGERAAQVGLQLGGYRVKVVEERDDAGGDEREGEREQREAARHRGEVGGCRRRRGGGR